MLLLQLLQSVECRRNLLSSLHMVQIFTSNTRHAQNLFLFWLFSSIHFRSHFFSGSLLVPKSLLMEKMEAHNLHLFLQVHKSIRYEGCMFVTCINQSSCLPLFHYYYRYFASPFLAFCALMKHALPPFPK